MGSKYLKTLGELIEQTKSAPQIPYVWSGIKEGSFGFVFGPSKSGKTTFCENMALSLIAGKESFFGKKLSKGPHRVLFVSLEEFYRERTLRNIRQLSQLEINLPPLNYLSNGEEFPRLLSTKLDWEKLESLIKESKAKIVFIDSMSRLYDGSIEESKLAKKILYQLRELTNRLKVTMIVIHHTPKMNGSPITIDSLAGSRMLAQEADFLIGVNRTINGMTYVKEVAFRYAAENTELVTPFSINSNSWLSPQKPCREYSLIGDLDGRISNVNTMKVLEVIKLLETKSDVVKYKDIETEAEKVGVARSTIFEQLKKLTARGEIIKVVKGQYQTVLEK